MIETILIMTLSAGLFWMPGMNADINASGKKPTRHSPEKPSGRATEHLEARVQEPASEPSPEPQCPLTNLKGAFIVLPLDACYKDDQEGAYRCPIYEALRTAYDRGKP